MGRIRLGVVFSVAGITVLMTTPVLRPIAAAHTARRRILLRSEGPGGGAITSLVAVTGRPKMLFAAALGAGVYRSSNGGRSWHRSSSGLPLDPRVGTMVVARSRPPLLYLATDTALYRSTHGGRSWRRVRSSGVEEVEADRRRPATVFASDVSHTYRSTDGGRHWSVIVDSRDEDLRSSNVEIAPSNPNIVYVHSADAFLRSHDGGATWEEASNEPELSGELIVNPTRPSTLYAASLSGVWKTVNGGSSWTFLKDLGPPALESAAIDPSHPQRVVIGTTDGCYVTRDGGATWRWRPTRIGTVKSLLIPPHSARVMAGFEGQGFAVSRDGARTWTFMNRGLTGTQIYSIVAPKARVAYASVVGIGIARTTDGGRTWRYLSRGPRKAWDLAAAPGSDLVYVRSGRGILRTQDGGRTWAKIHWGRYRALSVAVAPSRPRIVYVGLDSANRAKGIVVRSRDGGRTWHRMSKTLYSPYQLVVHPHRPNVVFEPLLHGTRRSTDGGRTWRLGKQDYEGILNLVLDPVRPIVYASGEESQQVYKSIDNGVHLSTVMRGLDGTITGLAIDPRRRHVLYAGSDQGKRTGGLFRTTTGGRRWRVVSSGLTSRRIRTIALNPSGKRIYLGTSSRGIFVGKT